MKIKTWTKKFSLYYTKYNLAMKNKPFFFFLEKKWHGVIKNKS